MKPVDQTSSVAEQTCPQNPFPHTYIRKLAPSVAYPETFVGLSIQFCMAGPGQRVGLCPKNRPVPGPVLAWPGWTLAVAGFSESSLCCRQQAPRLTGCGHIRPRCPPPPPEPLLSPLLSPTAHYPESLVALQVPRAPPICHIWLQKQGHDLNDTGWRS